ncbi:MAG TPA: hypothetical protein VFI98_08715, partial [Pseudolabrys sp.]|nr:hypothetical protein [Pseudolabrys sp.]
KTIPEKIPTLFAAQAPRLCMKRAVRACEIVYLPRSRRTLEIYSRDARADVLSESITRNISGLADSRGPRIHCR